MRLASNYSAICNLPCLGHCGVPSIIQQARRSYFVVQFMQIYKTRGYFVNCLYCAQFYSRCHQSDQVISCRLLVFFIPINFFVCNAYHSWRCHISFSFGSYYGFCGYSSPVKLSIASEIGCLSRLDESEFIESWIRCFAPQGRAQKLRDNQTKKKKELIDIFLTSTDCGAIMIISVSAYPKKLENLSFVEISEINTTISLLSALYNSPVLILIPISFCSFLYSWWRHILVFGCFIKYLFSCSCNHKLFFAAT